MVNFDTSFRHDLLQIAIGNRISDLEKHRVQDDIFRILVAFEVNRHVPKLTFEFKGRRLSQLGKQAHIPKVCDRTGSPLDMYSILSILMCEQWRSAWM